MSEKRLLYALGQVDESYIEEAAPGGFPQERAKGAGSRRGVVIALAAAIMVLGAAAALAAGRGISVLEWIVRAQPDSDPAYLQTQLDNGQWVYMDGDNIAVIVPESPVKILLSADAGETWRETVLVESKGMEYLGEWRENMRYHGGYIGFNGKESGYLVLTSGVSMNHQALRIFLTSDGGETWQETDTPYSQHVSVLTGAGFSSENIGFISYRYYEDAGPDIWWTSDGGETWSKLEVELPEDMKRYNFTPQSPSFDGLRGVYPIVAMSHEPEYETTVYLYSDDGGLTWRFDS